MLPRPKISQGRWGEGREGKNAGIPQNTPIMYTDVDGYLVLIIPKVKKMIWLRFHSLISFRLTGPSLNTCLLFPLEI